MGAELGSWRRLTPVGPGAVTVLALRRVHGEWPAWLYARDGALRAWPTVGELCLAQLRVDGQLLDEVLVTTPSHAERELHLHGGEGVVRAVSDALEVAGWRAATPATRARAPSCLRAAVATASGRWGRVAAARGEPSLAGAPAAAEGAPAAALRQHARRLAVPATVRLVGLPNAGKSTLFNRLLREERSLVSPRAGTTRDTVWAPTSVHGVPIRLEDTAGAGPQPDAGGGVADLWIHVLSRDGEPAVGGERCLAIGGRADVRYWPGRLAVSGATGAGLPQLRSAIATRLGILQDPAADASADLGPTPGQPTGPEAGDS